MGSGSLLTFTTACTHWTTDTPPICDMWDTHMEIDAIFGVQRMILLGGFATLALAVLLTVGYFCLRRPVWYLWLILSGQK